MTHSFTDDSEKRWAYDILANDPDFRVLTRHAAPDAYPYPLGGVDPRLHRGVVVDVETTSTDNQTAKITELGLAAFHFTPQGEVVGHVETRSWLEDPGEPLSAEVREVTGLTDAMLAGHRIDDEAATAILRSADLVIAHHAGFDRPICERRLPVCAEKPWACSWADVPWKAFGLRRASLDYLLQSVRAEFFDGHRALDDARATLHVLAAPAPVADQQEVPGTYLRLLLQSVRTPTLRVWARYSPYETKTILKARGYTWHPAEGPLRYPKTWYRDVPFADVLEEIAWLTDHVYQDIDAPIMYERINARRRYSFRHGPVHTRAVVLADTEATNREPGRGEGALEEDRGSSGQAEAEDMHTADAREAADNATWD